jgi:hypothetical protein
MKIFHIFIIAWFACVFVMLPISAVSVAAGDDLGPNGSQAPYHDPPPQPNSPTWQTDVDNGDGTYTFTQQVDEASTPPNYLGSWSSPSSHGFEIYSWFDGDYGWLHTFPHWNGADLNILSATLTIHAYDIDSEPFHGYEGEYDGVHIDGTLLSPGYLQGNNNAWSTTVFDVPLGSITDDGDIAVFLDIDMHHNYDNWATTLDYSQLAITYSFIANDPPYQPVLSYGIDLDTDCITGGECSVYGQDLVVTVVGPDPADPDGNTVTYVYRWFVDVGTGGFIDDEFAGRGDHTGNTVPAMDIQPNDIWQVQVIPVDEYGAIGQQTTVTFPEFCTEDCPFGDICGTVERNDGYPIENVTVKVIDSENDQVGEPQVTDANGEFYFAELPAETYSVMIVTPLGYSAAPSETQSGVEVPIDPCTEVNFVLTPTITANDCRTIGYWKHQFDVYLTNRGNAQESSADLYSYLNIVHVHFNILGVYFDLGNYDFEDAKDVLTVRGGRLMEDRAKQQLFALLLNFASGRIGNETVVADDGRVAAEAVTLAAMLINDGDPANDELAKTVCDLINNGQMVGAGIIPMSPIRYKLIPDQLPQTTSLSYCYPNPFNAQTTITFDVPDASYVRLTVFNVMGQVVAVPVERYMEAGTRSVVWNAADVGSGTYFYRLDAGRYCEFRKMTLLK